MLVASLHQGIGEVLPTRLGFYENWLNPKGLREGTIGLAPLYAVLSFLRQEGALYGDITTRAGEYAAEWTVADMSPTARRCLRALPTGVRRFFVVRQLGRFVRATYRPSRAASETRRGTVRVDVRDSVFCVVRQPVAHALCGFYAAAFVRLLALFDLPVRADMLTCRATGEPGCTMTLTPDDRGGEG
ncbi:MAG: hypothetical protein ABUS56_00525 [Acidobacteriota bacterium]